ncbi:MAG TPA: carbonic anhydrase family protein [Thiomicrospira sp.]|nr:carbonic anhydrase family protein [Thiomicrospira sp.]
MSATPQPSHSDEILIDLGAELKAKGGVDNHGVHSKATPQTHSEPSTTKSHEPAMVHKPEKSATKDAHPVHWGYSGEEGPRHWGDLAAENIQCKIGKNQSPIDLRDKAGVGTNGLPELSIQYRDVPLKVVNNGHTLQVNYPLGSYIKVGNHRYELLQFHFHTPSEHKKEGFNYPMEVHLVHKDGDGNLAVMGVIFQEGEENEQIQTLLDHLPKSVGKQEIHKNISLNPVMFIPGNTEFYKYSGSLTTPPCSEGVYWMVFKHPIEASAEQIQLMNEVLGENARPTQDMNSRALLKSWSEQLQEPPLYEFY